MSYVEEINVVLEQRLSLFSELPDVAWPNSGYDPSPDKVYLEPFNTPLAPLRLGLNDDSSVRRDGIYQINVFGPKGAGVKETESLAKGVAQHFPKGTELFTVSGHKVRVKYNMVETGQSVGVHYAIPVLVHYSAITD